MKNCWVSVKKGWACVFFLGAYVCASEQSVPQKPLVVVIPSYNNSKYYQKNLDSVFSQQYTNYRVIYIDDCSLDGTGELVKKYIQDNHQEHRVTFIKNEQHRGALANHYTAGHMCQNHEIIVQLDGDDWFKHERVLATVNKAYQDPNVWLTYSQHEMYPTPQPLQNRVMAPAVIELNAYREFKWVASALRTFYAGLFKRIKLQDLLYNGAFFEVTCDLAFMFPMLEMTGGKLKFIDEILYVYNVENNINDFKVRGAKQLRMDNMIRARDPYKRLTTPPYFSDIIEQKDRSAELIIFSDNLENLQSLLDSVSLYLSGVGHITVLYLSANPLSLQSWQACQAQFPATYICLDSQTKLKPALLSCLSATIHDYIIFARDTNMVHNFADFSECALLLEKTRAYGFFLGLDKNTKTSRFISRELKTPPMVEFQPGAYAWQFATGEYDWRMAHNLFLTLYRKVDIAPLLADLTYEYFDDFTHAFEKVPTLSTAIGLFSEQEK